VNRLEGRDRGYVELLFPSASAHLEADAEVVVIQNKRSASVASSVASTAASTKRARRE